ncbi:MAG: translocation/assembly module TamB, partial [Spirochaetota bacterium]|nr:translocation/assembly module TamB [Spirochaetota bacterium]
PKNNIISSNFNFNDFNLKNLSKNLKGQLTGHLDIRGNVSNPKLMSSGMKITNGKYENINFNADFSFKKSDKELIVPHGNISFGDSTIQVKNLKYYLPKIQTSLSDYFNDLKPNGTISAENFIFFYKKSKIELYNLNYFIGNKSIPILKDISHNNLNANNNILFDVYQILQNPNSKFTFQKGLITLGKNYFLIESFLFAPGDNWRLDCDIKVKSNFLKNFYLAQFSLFGGRKNNEHAELNIKANNLQINDQKHNDIEFIFEAVGNKWKLWPNRLGINLDLILTKNLLDYILTFKGQSTKLISTGKVDFDNENIDIDIKLVNDDLSISKITSLLLNKAKGKLYTDVKLFGKWNNPQLTGIFKFEKGEIQLIDQESIENINIILQFNQGKPDKNHFIHSINASANYNEGIANIIGSFNFSNWNFTNYEFKFITPKKMLLDLKNNIFEYKGYIKSDLYLVGTQKENRLSGTIRLSEGKAVYVGRKKIKEVSKNFFTTLNFDVVEIIVENDVKANIGPDRISLGEVILKEYNPKTNEGTRLKLKKRLTDVKSDNFLLEGEIETKKGEFDYLGHTFKIINSKIIFKPNQNPKIEINSRTKVRDEDNRLVTIYLKLNNELNSLLEESSTTPEKENILLKSLSSSPTKSPQEIILLLGITEGTGEKERDPYNQSYSNISASKTADVALNLTLIKPIERKLKEIFGIDTFNIRQKFLRNTLFRKSQSYTSNTGSIPTDRSELNPLSDTEITVGKYLTDDIYFSTGLLLLQNLDRSGETKKIWKFGLEADLLPLFNIESERVKLQLGIEYHRKPDEILPANRNEGIINFELNIEF